MKDLLAKKNNLKCNDLVVGQTYVLSKNANFDDFYIFKFQGYKTTYHSVFCYFICINNFWSGNTFGEGSLAIYDRYIRKATHSEEEWLQECKNQKKFVPLIKKFRLWNLMK